MPFRLLARKLEAKRPSRHKIDTSLRPGATPIALDFRKLKLSRLWWRNRNKLSFCNEFRRLGRWAITHYYAPATSQLKHRTLRQAHQRPIGSRLCSLTTQRDLAVGTRRPPESNVMQLKPRASRGLSPPEFQRTTTKHRPFGSSRVACCDRYRRQIGSGQDKESEKGKDTNHVTLPHGEILTDELARAECHNQDRTRERPKPVEGLSRSAARAARLGAPEV